MKVERQDTISWCVSRYGDYYHSRTRSVDLTLYTTLEEALEVARDHFAFELGTYHRDCPGKRYAQNAVDEAKRALAELEKREAPHA